MKTMMFRPAVGIAVAAFGSVVPAHPQDDVSMRSQQAGMEVLATAIDALGGLGAIEQVSIVELKARVSNIGLGQAARPGGDVSAGGVVYYHQTHVPNAKQQMWEIFQSDTATQATAKLVITPADTFVVVFGTNQVREVDLGTLQPIFRAVPNMPALLMDVRDRAASVRYLGMADEHGMTLDVITYANADAQQVALYVDRATGFLRKSAVVLAHAQLGDHVVEVYYNDYQPAGPLQLPRAVRVVTGGRESSVVEFTAIEFGGSLDAEKLVRPADMELGPPITTTPENAELTVEELSDGVYLIPNAAPFYNAMFVAFDDHVLVLEAPLSPEVSHNVMRTIRETVPGKPIRYAAITHYHFDHSGGLFGYMQEDVTVVTTPGNEEFVREVAAVPRTLDGATPVHHPKIETVTDRRTFTDGARSVVLYQIGPNPHVDEIMIAYIPALKLLFVADIYSYTGQVTPANDQALSLAGKIEELGLDIEIVIPVHGQQTTGEDFWESVRLGREGT